MSPSLHCPCFQEMDEKWGHLSRKISPMLTSLGLAHHTCANRVGSITLPWKGTGPALPSIGTGRDRDITPTLMTTGLPVLPAPGIDLLGRREGSSPLSMPP